MERIKIAYRFADGHIEEVEVEQEVADALEELDRQEYNNTKKETRRHTLLSAMEYEGQCFADQGLSTEWIAIGKIGAAEFWAAFRKLKPRQQELLFSLYFSDRPISPAEYAARLGVREESVWQNAWRAKKSLKKLLEKL
jgi:DNA-directed RNA polymerase specialized sigma24 family protein